MTLQDYVEKIKADWEYTRRNRPASEVLLGPMLPIRWREALSNAGYYHADLSGVMATGFNAWKDAHRWCIDNFGKEHYTWTGERFWFETDQDALLFRLRWA